MMRSTLSGTAGTGPGSAGEASAPGDRYPTAAFDYELPPERIARHPSDRRDESRLMLLDREAGTVSHRVFRDLAELIPAGDALVVNETKVFPARLIGRRESGAEAEVLLLRPVAAPGDGAGDGAVAGAPAAGTNAARESAAEIDWEALVRPGAKLRPGRVVTIADDLRVEVLDVNDDGSRIVRLVTPLPVDEALDRYGRIPLPPYMRRDPGPEDMARYQTVFASERGSVAAPTAGLHFTRSLLDALEARGVRLVRVVLHVGVGTFRPVEVEDPAAHRMHAEHYRVAPEAAAALNEIRAGGGAIWAVGTTVARTLETVTDEAGVVHPGAGWTDLFIRPPYRFRAVDRLITNFHLPRSTLLMLVSAFGGYESVMRAYREAIAGRYRFYSYGDAMAII